MQRNTEQLHKAVEINKNTEKLMSKSNELCEADARKCNAILYGAQEESECPVMDQVETFMKKECFKNLDTPHTAIRLGKRNIENQHNRPIKIIFENEQSKWAFIKRVNSGALKSEKIVCKLDVSKEIRNQEYALRERIRELKKEDSDASYRLRNLQIEQKQSTGEWKRLTPAQRNKITTI